METVCITGANRGIGLELVRKFADAGYQVIACCRRPDDAKELLQLKGPSVSIHELDVTNADHIHTLISELDDAPIDVLINNAGIMGGDRQAVSDIDTEAWSNAFDVNTIAPFRLLAALEKNLQLADNPRAVTISSQMGSLARNTPGSVIYRSSKAAVNKAMQVAALELKSKGITVCVMHPGWVRTEMGGPNASISAKQSADGLFNVITGLTISDTGSFLTWDGNVHPW